MYALATAVHASSEPTLAEVLMVMTVLSSARAIPPRVMSTIRAAISRDNHFFIRVNLLFSISLRVTAQGYNIYMRAGRA